MVAGTDGALAAYQATRDLFAGELLAISDEIASLAWDYPRAKVLHHRLSRGQTLTSEQLGDRVRVASNC